MGDIGELHGIYKVFGQLPVAVSATKSMTGHLLGGAGAIESIISVLSIKNNIIPGTINTTELDEKIPSGMNIVIGESRQTPVNYVVNNTFGFGGHTATSVFKKA